MFEKEAEEYEKRKHYLYEDNEYCRDIADVIIQAYQKGAEFGYNKAKEDIDDFNNWLEHRPIAEKLDNFFTFNILIPLTTFWYFIQIPFRGLKWWKEQNELLCKNKTFEMMFKVYDDIENNNFDKAKKDLDIVNHCYEEGDNRNYK